MRPKLTHQTITVPMPRSCRSRKLDLRLLGPQDGLPIQHTYFLTDSKLVSALRSIVSTNAEVAAKIRTAANHFERNADRMRYPKFRRQHLFVGSSVIEAGCKP